MGGLARCDGDAEPSDAGRDSNDSVVVVGRIDQPPGKLMRLVFRAPIYLYRFGLGRLMSKRLLLLIHTGRKSRQPRYAVLEVARHDEPSGTFYVPAAYGRKADWYRNVLETPRVLVNHRGRQMEMVAEVVPADVAAEEFAKYVISHPRSASSLGSLMGIPFDDPRAVANKIPLVALRSR